MPSTVRADVPQAMDDVFARLYARHDRRYESAEAVLNELDERLKQTTSIPVPPLPPAATVNLGERSTCSSCGHVTEPG